MQVEDCLAGGLADVDDHAVVVEALAPRDVGDELEHRLRLVLLEGGDIAEGLDVTLRDHEQVRVGPRVDVPDRNEARHGMDVVALANEGAKECRMTLFTASLKIR